MSEQAKLTLLDLIRDKCVIDVASTLMAKLEYILHDDHRQCGVFRTRWGDELFSACVTALMGADVKFDIDEWFKAIPKSYKKGSDGSITVGVVQTNWLLPLLETELKYPGFLSTLHNSLELEDQTHEKLAKESKEKATYDFYGIGSVNPLLLSLEGPKGGPRQSISYK